jgi:PRTRC genetic system protein E
MTTNFFEHIAGLNVQGTFKLAITVNATGSITVSELFTAACGDKAAGLINPLTLTGTAQELDEAFFGKIAEPTQKVAGLIVNMESHLKSVEAARVASKMEQDKKTTANKAAATQKDADHEMPDQRAEKKKAYEEAIKAISDLNDKCKYEEALDILPSETDYPEKTADIKKLRSQLELKREQLKKISLFS